MNNVNIEAVDKRDNTNNCMFIFNPKENIQIINEIVPPDITDVPIETLLRLSFMSPEDLTEEEKAMTRATLKYEEYNPDTCYVMVSQDEPQSLSFHAFPEDEAPKQIEALIAGVGEDYFYDLKVKVVRSPGKGEMDKYMSEMRPDQNKGLLKVRRYQLKISEDGDDYRVMDVIKIDKSILERAI